MRTVVDANVLVAANAMAPHAGIACASAAAKALLALQAGGPLLEDSSDEAFAEYKRYCSFSGQPGVGDRFFRWFMQNRYVPTHVQQVDITEFTLDAALQAMDRSDQKWLEIYLAGGAAGLLNATDSDYEEHRGVLKAHDIQVMELCPDRPRRTTATTG